MSNTKESTYDIRDLSSKTISFIEFIRLLIKLIKPYKLYFWISIIFVLINSAIAIVSPELLGNLTDDYVLVGDKEGLIRSSGVLLALYLTSFVAHYLQIRFMGIVGQNVILDIRNQIFDKVQYLPKRFFSQNKSGDLISRINNDTDKVSQALIIITDNRAAFYNCSYWF